MAEVLTWVMQRRIALADRVEQLRKELAETEAEVARPEAAEVVIGQFIEAERAGEADDPAMDAELERMTTPGAGGLLLVPLREDGMDQGVLPEDYQAIMRVVAGAAEPVGLGKSSLQARAAMRRRPAPFLRDRFAGVPGDPEAAVRPGGAAAPRRLQGRSRSCRGTRTRCRAGR
ncbi:hypothetical protein [Streptomyces sp. TE5632]